MSTAELERQLRDLRLAHAMTCHSYTDPLSVAHEVAHVAETDVPEALWRARGEREGLEGAPIGRGRRWVRVWFGSHVVVQKVTGVAAAAHYEAAMKRRFAGLRVTNDPEGSR